MEPHAAVESPWKQDLAEAAHLAQKYAVSRGRSEQVRRSAKLADLQLLAELVLHIVITYALVYWVEPLWLKAVLLAPWSLYSALALDNVLHYLNHWPIFHSERLNILVRLLSVPLFACPLEIRYTHWEHHKYNDIEVDQRTWMRSIAEQSPYLGVSILRYVWDEVVSGLRGTAPWAALPPHLDRLRHSRRRHFIEIRAIRWINCLFLGALLWWQPFLTLVFFIPAVMLAPLVACLLMNLTDHLPGELTCPFRQATYLVPQTLGERMLCAINRQSGATHLTHHLFPQVHWTQLPALQTELLPLYERHRAPRSLLHTSLLVGNWLSLGRLYVQVTRECRRLLRADPAAQDT